jgi:hypothetical protein
MKRRPRLGRWSFVYTALRVTASFLQYAKTNVAARMQWTMMETAASARWTDRAGRSRRSW